MTEREGKEGCLVTAGRYLFRERQLLIYGAAMQSARKAAQSGDRREQARLLRVAVRASDAVARLYGLLPVERSDVSVDVEVALKIIAAVQQRANTAASLNTDVAE